MSGLGEDLEAHVAALLGPFVGLLGQDRADQPDDGGAVGEDPDDVGAAADLLVQPFLRVVRPDLAPELARERGERQQVLPGGVEVLARRRGTSRPARRRPGRTGRAPGRRRAGRRWCAPGWAPTAAPTWAPGRQVARVVGAAPLPARPGQRRLRSR